MVKWKKQKNASQKGNWWGIPLTGVLEKVASGGVTKRGTAWARLKLEFDEKELPFFTENEDEMNEIMKEVEEGDKVKVWIAGKEEKLRIAKMEKLENEEEGLSSDEEEQIRPSSLFIPLVKCPNCNEQMVWFKHEIGSAMSKLDSAMEEVREVLKLKE